MLNSYIIYLSGWGKIVVIWQRKYGECTVYSELVKLVGYRLVKMKRYSLQLSNIYVIPKASGHMWPCVVNVDSLATCILYFPVPVHDGKHQFFIVN